MPRFANRVVALSLFGAVTAVGAVGTAPLYLPRLFSGAQTVSQPQAPAGQLQDVMARLDRVAEQIERMRNAQERQEKEIASLKLQQERTSDRIATATRQVLDLAQYTSQKGSVTREELEEIKRAASLSQQQIDALRTLISSTSRRSAQH